MVNISTNVLISNEPAFLEFSCNKAELLISEREAWKNRHQYDTAMAPYQNTLFFVSQKELPSFIKKESIEETFLRSDHEQDRRLLTFLANQALKIKLRQKGLFRLGNFHFKEEDISAIKGNSGSSYDVIRGVKPRICFEQGYCLIVFEPVSKIFERISTISINSSLERLLGICMCNNCNEHIACEKEKHQIMNIEKTDKSRILMHDIKGGRADCPAAYVRCEASRRTMAGDYSAILRQTAINSLDEYTFVSGFVNALSKGSLVLDLGKGIAFSWLQLE